MPVLHKFAMKIQHEEFLAWFLVYRSLEATGEEEVPLNLQWPNLLSFRARSFYEANEVAYTDPYQSAYEDPDDVTRF